MNETKTYLRSSISLWCIPGALFRVRESYLYLQLSRYQISRCLFSEKVILYEQCAWQLLYRFEWKFLKVNAQQTDPMNICLGESPTDLLGIYPQTSVPRIGAF